MIPIFYAMRPQKSLIVAFVNQILAKPYSSAVPRLEAEIDRLVYALYGLTANESRIVEAERGG